MNIELLLKAAKLLESQEQDLLCDHGYASSSPPVRDSWISTPGTGRRRRNKTSLPVTTKVCGSRRRSSTSSSSHSPSPTSGIRYLHNELEKSRRANLRHCFDRLRDVMPKGGPSAKNTTLQLLKRAKLHITRLEEDYQNHEQMKTQLIQQQRRLHGSLQQLGAGYPLRDFVMETRDGETSPFQQDDMDIALSVTSNSDSDDIDVMGSASESDDYGR